MKATLFFNMAQKILRPKNCKYCRRYEDQLDRILEILYHTNNGERPKNVVMDVELEEIFDDYEQYIRDCHGLKQLS